MNINNNLVDDAIALVVKRLGMSDAQARKMRRYLERNDAWLDAAVTGTAKQMWEWFVVADRQIVTRNEVVLDLSDRIELAVYGIKF